MYWQEEEDVTKDYSERSLILDILLDVNKKGAYSHIAIKTLLDEHPYLNSVQKGFIKKVSEGKSNEKPPFLKKVRFLNPTKKA